MQDYKGNPYTEYAQWLQSMWQQWARDAGTSQQAGAQSAQRGNPFTSPFGAFNPATAYSSWMDAAKSVNPGAFAGSFNNPWLRPNAASWANPWTSQWTNPWANMLGNPWGGSSPWQMPGFMFGDWNSQWTELCNRFSDLAGKVSEAGADHAKSAAEWMPSFDEMFGKLRQSFDSINSDNAKRIADTVKMFGGTAPGFSPFAAPEGSFPGMPKVGPMRMQHKAHEEHARKVAKLAECSKAYAECVGRIPVRALDMLREELLQLAREDKPVTSLRALYDMWVSCVDTVSKEVVLAEEYPALYADMNNAMLNVIASARELAEPHSKALGQVSRESFSVMARRQQQQQRAMHMEVLPNLGQINSELRSLREQSRQTQEQLQRVQDEAGQMEALRALPEQLQRLEQQLQQLLPLQEQSRQMQDQLRQLQGYAGKLDDLLALPEQLRQQQQQFQQMQEQLRQLRDDAGQAEGLQALPGQLQQLEQQIQQLALLQEQSRQMQDQIQRLQDDSLQAEGLRALPEQLQQLEQQLQRLLPLPERLQQLEQPLQQLPLLQEQMQQFQQQLHGLQLPQGGGNGHPSSAGVHEDSFGSGDDDAGSSDAGNGSAGQAR